MVAACIRADTGVGPAMASGSQTCSGNWADFPMAPMKIASPAQKAYRARVGAPSSTPWRMSVKRKDPTDTDRMMAPMNNPTSATLLVRNALIAADEFSCSSQ